MPIGQGSQDFILNERPELVIRSIIPPTSPKDSLCMFKDEKKQYLGMGQIAWRLINMISLNHLTLAQPNGHALREMLYLFADTTDNFVKIRIDGIVAVEARAVTKRFALENTTGIVKGIEIAIVFDDNNFGGHGVFLFGAILDRFFCTNMQL